MNYDLETLNAIKQNSIGNDKKSKKDIKRKNVTKKILTLLLTALLMISACACSNRNENQSEKYEYNVHYVEMYNFMISTSLETTLKSNNLDWYIPNNTIEDYVRILNQLDEKDMIVYYDKMGSKECEKICIAFGYEGLNDFLIKNNYIDEKGNPSLEVLKKATYDRVTKEEVGKTK